MGVSPNFGWAPPNFRWHPEACLFELSVLQLCFPNLTPPSISNLSSLTKRSLMVSGHLDGLTEISRGNYTVDHIRSQTVLSEKSESFKF